MSTSTKFQLGGLIALLLVIWVLDLIVARMGNRVLRRLPAADQATAPSEERSRDSVHARCLVPAFSGAD